jgi:hypothetical protein
VPGLLLVGPLAAARRPPRRGQTAREAAELAQSLRGGVGLFADEWVEASLILGAQGWGRATAVWLGVESAGIAATPEQAEDEGEADTGPAGDLPSRALTLIDGRRDPLAKILSSRAP